MKRFFKTLWQGIMMTAMAFMGAIVCIHLFDYEYAPVAGFFFCGLLGALVTGVFDEPERHGTHYESIRHREGYRKAA